MYYRATPTQTKGNTEHMSKILISVENLSDTPTSTEVINAVRRAFSANDVNLTVGTVGTSKGVTYRLRKTPKAAQPVETVASQARAWAKANKIKLGARGRIPAEVMAQFQATV